MAATAIPSAMANKWLKNMPRKEPLNDFVHLGAPVPTHVIALKRCVGGIWPIEIASLRSQ
jgi:hypothetical protein